MPALNESIINAVKALAEPYMEEHGYELVDVEFVKEGGNRILRIVADKPGGIDIEDCSRISEYMSAKLDEVDPIPDAYFLEVTSPGAERPLKKPADFERAVGKHVFVTTYEPVDGRKEFEGELTAYDGEQLVVRIGRQSHAIPAGKVATARLAVIL
jgi:ribosome maturation factor RimP